MLAPAATAAWLASALPAWAAFRRALSAPEQAQAAVLARLLRQARGSAFARAHDLRTERAFAALPVHSWDELAPWVERAAAGERDVLTTGPISRFEPTSGTTSARKLVPSTAASRRELRSAVGAWVVDTYGRDPPLAGGRAYWSISPALPPERTAGGTPIGFDDDAGYLGGLAERLVRRALVAVEPGADFWAATARALRAAPDLRLISVWNPSFAGLLLDAVDRPPRELWPGLRLWSAWADGAAASAVDEVQRRLGPVRFQAKGLLATEGVVSIPFAGTHPIAVTSHYLELLSDDGALRPLAAARAGDEGRVVLTTGAGLWRYLLGDRVRVTGRLAATPTIRFLGRDRTVDRRGEKLTEAFVDGVLAALGLRRFALLAPEERGYVLYTEDPADAERLETLLSANPHYRWCVALGQLAPARVVVVRAGAAERYVLAKEATGMRRGDVKPPRLEPTGGWDEALR